MAARLLLPLLLLLASPLMAFDHQRWDALLDNHVQWQRGGVTTSVDYPGLRKDRAALDEYFRAWNAADNDAVAAISNFPRLSLGQNGQVVVRETPEEIATDFDVLRQSGWDHSTLDLAEAVHVSADKVHFRIVFSRYSADGKPYTTVPGLYVITNQNGHWGLQLQSILPATFTR